MRPGDERRPKDLWRTRIRDPAGRVLGAGMLLGERHVLTCAHVVAPGDDLPRGHVVVDFAGRPAEPSTRARVEPDGWVPSRATGEGDLALLRLDRPQPAGFGTLLQRLPTLWHYEVHAQGYPVDTEHTRGVTMALAGDTGPSEEWVQLIRWEPGEPSRGFSGAAVVSDRTGHVVGMVVGRSKRGPAGVAYMIPVETIVRYLPQVSDWVRGDGAVDQRMVRQFEEDVDVPFAQQVSEWIAAPGNVRVIITGGHDSSRSKTLRSVVTSSDRERRPPAELLDQAPDGTVAPLGRLDLAVDVSDLAVEEIVRRILGRLGIQAGTDMSAAERVRQGISPMTLVLDGVDDAAEPVALVDGLLRPLAEQGSCLLLGFHRDASAALDQARSLETEATAAEGERAGRLIQEVTTKTDELRTAEKKAMELWRHVAPRIAGTPHPPDHAASFGLLLLRDRWTVREAAHLLRRADRALMAVERYREMLEKTLADRNEARGLLETFKARAAACGLAENLELAGLHGTAYRLLNEELPADLHRAGTAVERYVDAVRRKCEQRRGRPDE